MNIHADIHGQPMGVNCHEYQSLSNYPSGILYTSLDGWTPINVLFPHGNILQGRISGLPKDNPMNESL